MLTILTKLVGVSFYLLSLGRSGAPSLPLLYRSTKIAQENVASNCPGHLINPGIMWPQFFFYRYYYYRGKVTFNISNTTKATDCRAHEMKTTASEDHQCTQLKPQANRCWFINDLIGWYSKTIGNGIRFGSFLAMWVLQWVVEGVPTTMMGVWPLRLRVYS